MNRSEVLVAQREQLVAAAQLQRQQLRGDLRELLALSRPAEVGARLLGQLGTRPTLAVALVLALAAARRWLWRKFR